MIFPTQRLNLDLSRCGQILYQLSYQGSPNVRVKIGNLIYLTNGEKTQELKVLEYAAAVAAAAKSLQSCPTLCDPINRSPSGSSVPGILQARILEWVALASSKGSSQPRD